MLTLSQLPPGELRRRLAGDGLRLQTGPFVLCVRSRIAQMIEGLALVYADYPVHGPERFADFHIHMDEAGGLRRFFHPQVRFDHDGDAPFQPLPRHHAFVMFEWVLNWCISSRAHAWLIIHAAVVEKDGCAAILPAPPGSGKSTLCAALVQRGWRLLTDELAMVQLSDGRLLPVPRPVSLKNASIDVIARFAPDAVFSPSVADTSKGTVGLLKAPADSVTRAGETARPAWVVFPKYAADAAPAMTPVAPARAFMQLAENAFNYNLLGAAGFQAMGRLIDQCASYQFVYSRLDDAIAAFDALPRPAP